MGWAWPPVPPRAGWVRRRHHSQPPIAANSAGTATAITHGSADRPAGWACIGGVVGCCTGGVAGAVTVGTGTLVAGGGATVEGGTAPPWVVVVGGGVVVGPSQ